MTEDLALRTNRLVRGVGSSLIARGISSVAPLILIPITLDYLGAERYGVWMALTALSSMFLWADLGLGNSLMTRLTPLVVAEKWSDARLLVSSAYRILVKVSLVGCLLNFAAYALLPWSELLNAPASIDTARVALICLLAFALNIPLSLVHRVLFALQRVSTSNWLQMVGSFLAVAGGAVTVALKAEPLAVIGAVVFAPVVTNILATVLVLARSKLRPALSVRGPASRGLVTSGLRFVVIGVMTSLALNVDYLIVAHGASVEEVAWYSVVARIFLALGLLVTVVNLPLWPANGEALARGDLAWVRRATSRMMLLSAGGVLGCGVALAAAKDPIVHLLAGGEATSSLTLVLGFVAMWTLFAVASPLFMVQNAVGHLGPQTGGWAAYLFLSVPTKVFVASSYGVNWIPWAASLLYAVTVLPSAWLGFKQAMASATGHGGGESCIGSAHAASR